MTEHRFLISIPFTIFMWLWFMGLGWIAKGKIIQRNVIISTIGGLAFMLVINIP